jgi:hypothetical protein
VITAEAPPTSVLDLIHYGLLLLFLGFVFWLLFGRD